MPQFEAPCVREGIQRLEPRSRPEPWLKMESECRDGLKEAPKELAEEDGDNPRNDNPINNKPRNSDDRNSLPFFFLKGQ